MTELHGVKEREAAGFTSALRETFKTIVFPTGKALRKVDDFRMEFDRNDYSGEQQIVDTLTKRGKFIPSDQFDAQFDNIRLDAEEILFDADAVQQSSLRRNAAVRSGWFWLPRGGLDQLDPHRRPARLLAREGWPRRQEMGAAHARHRPAGRFRTGPDGHRPLPDQRHAGGCRHRLCVGERAARPDDGEETRRSRLRDDGAGGVVPRRRQQGRRHDRRCVRVARADPREAGREARLRRATRCRSLAIPRAAIIRATFDGSDPKTGAGGRQPRSMRRRARRSSGPSRRSTDSSARRRARRFRPAWTMAAAEASAAKAGAEARCTRRHDLALRAEGHGGGILGARPARQDTPNVHILGGSIELNGARSEADFLTLRLGRDVPVAASDLDAMVKTLVEKLNAPRHRP